MTMLLKYLELWRKKRIFDFVNSNFFQSEINKKMNLNTKYEKKAIDSGRNTNYFIFKKKYE